MKRLITLISTEGKTVEQITKQTWEAFQKFQKVHKESLKSAQEQFQKK